jgi:hypothetical protein
VRTTNGQSYCLFPALHRANTFAKVVRNYFHEVRMVGVARPPQLNVKECTDYTLGAKVR